MGLFVGSFLLWICKQLLQSYLKKICNTFQEVDYTVAQMLAYH